MGTFLEIENLDVVRELKLIRWIDPKQIKYIAKNDFRCDSPAEHACTGDWDQELSLFDECPTYKACKDVFIKGIPWNETEFYISGRLQKFQIICEQDRAYYKKARCEYLNYLFNAMRTFGYAQDPNSDLVGLAIGRNGEIIINNGRHRVALAKILSIPLIPVTVDVRHTEWIKFCKDVTEYTAVHNGMIYSPVDHFDFSCIPSRQEDRSELIIKHMSPKNRSLVDLGANWGLMCHKLEGYYKEVVAVEKDPVEFAFLQKFKNVYKGSYEVVNDDAFDFIKKRNEWDCVLMMSILHHIPEEKRYKLLNTIKAKEMFFQFPSKTELDVNIQDWVDMIISSSCFDEAEKISKNGDREIFHFTR